MLWQLVRLRWILHTYKCSINITIIITIVLIDWLTDFYSPSGRHTGLRLGLHPIDPLWNKTQVIFDTPFSLYPSKQENLATAFSKNTPELGVLLPCSGTPGSLQNCSAEKMTHSRDKTTDLLHTSLQYILYLQLLDCLGVHCIALLDCISVLWSKVNLKRCMTKEQYMMQTNKPNHSVDYNHFFACKDSLFCPCIILLPPL